MKKVLAFAPVSTLDSAWSSCLSEMRSILGPILISNRGDCAQRIFDAAKKLDIPVIVIYTDADSQAPYVK